MTHLNEVETKVLQKLLSGDHNVLAILRQQAAHAEVSSRRMTGAGFFTELYVPTDTPKIKRDLSFKLGDVNGRATNVQHGLGFLLYIKNGVLSLLEGYTYDEPWPESIDNLSLIYSGGESRNWVELNKIVEQD